MRVEARAPGKLILFGEYAVLDGAPAVSAAVDRCAEVVVSARDAGPWTIASDLGDGVTLSLEVRGDRLAHASGAAMSNAPWIVRAVEETLRRCGTRPADLPPLQFEVRSGAFFERDAGAKLGLGSSAAVVVALGAATRRLLRALRPDEHVPTAAEAFDDDLRVHRALQRTGSGVDVATSFHGGVIAFVREAGQATGASVERLVMPADLHLACAWTGASTSTAEFLEGVRACRDERPDEYRRGIEHLTNVAGRALQAFRARRGADLVALADDYNRAMSRFGETCGIPVVSPAHEALAQLARSAGAAYKPSGAGGGDVGLLFAETRRALDAAAEAVRGAGYGLVDLEFRETGVTVHPS